MKKGDCIAKWDPFNAVIVTEYAGTLKFNDVIEGIHTVLRSMRLLVLRERSSPNLRIRRRFLLADVIDANGEVDRYIQLPGGWSRCMSRMVRLLRAGEVLG